MKMKSIQQWKDGEMVGEQFVSENVFEARERILAELDQIDRKSIRPAREGNQVRLAALEAQAAALRLELAGL